MPYPKPTVHRSFYCDIHELSEGLSVAWWQIQVVEKDQSTSVARCTTDVRLCEPGRGVSPAPQSRRFHRQYRRSYRGIRTYVKLAECHEDGLLCGADFYWRLYFGMLSLSFNSLKPG